MCWVPPGLHWRGRNCYWTCAHRNTFETLLLLLYIESRCLRLAIRWTYSKQQWRTTTPKPRLIIYLFKSWQTEWNKALSQQRLRFHARTLHNLYTVFFISPALLHLFDLFHLFIHSSCFWHAFTCFLDYPNYTPCACIQVSFSLMKAVVVLQKHFDST